MKYIIDIEDTPHKNNGNKLWKASSFNSLVFDQNGLDKLEPLDDACKNCLDKGDADEAYKCGLEDGWDAAKKIALPTANGGYSSDELNECFGKERETVKGMLKNTPVTEAVKKIREYEKRKAQDNEIKVGDEVKAGDKDIGVVIRATENHATILIEESCEVGFKQRICDMDNLTKTGRHVDLLGLLGGEEE